MNGFPHFLPTLRVTSEKSSQVLVPNAQTKRGKNMQTNSVNESGEIVYYEEFVLAFDTSMTRNRNLPKNASSDMFILRSDTIVHPAARPSTPFIQRPLLYVVMRLFAWVLGNECYSLVDVLWINC